MHFVFLYGCFFSCSLGPPFIKILVQVVLLPVQVNQGVSDCEVPHHRRESGTISKVQLNEGVREKLVNPNEQSG